MCTKKHVPRKKGYWQIVKTGSQKQRQKQNQRNKLKQNKKNRHFFNSVCKHIKIEILTLQTVFPDKLFK